MKVIIAEIKSSIGDTYGESLTPMEQLKQLNCCNGVEQVERLFVNVASALNYGGYGEKQGYKPSSKEYPMIIHMNTKRAWVEL